MHLFLQDSVIDAMSREIITVSPQMSIRELEAQFKRYGYNMFPVVENDILLGIISEFDFLKIFIFNNRSMVPPYETLLQKTVADIYTQKPLTLRPTQPLTRVLEIMIETMYKSFPVVDDTGKLMGVLARGDVIRRLRSYMNKV